MWILFGESLHISGALAQQASLEPRHVLFCACCPWAPDRLRRPGMRRCYTQMRLPHFPTAGHSQALEVSKSREE